MISRRNIYISFDIEFFQMKKLYLFFRRLVKQIPSLRIDFKIQRYSNDNSNDKIALSSQFNFCNCVHTRHSFLDTTCSCNASIPS